ncbi:MAG TPA: metallophosphoesterase [Opitutaceae bacterium]|nr:metallophosphoesterase [Opitutaceae bacterium]
MSATVIRILSDVHYGDAASLVHSTDALRPLFAGADTVIFNGDSVEMLPSQHTESLRRRKEELVQFVQHIGAKVIFIAGNHDPDISSIYHLDLAGGRILVTHGEILFEKLVPWGWDRHVIYRKYRAALAARTEAEQNSLEGKLEAAKEIMRTLEESRHLPAGGFLRRIQGFAMKLWPPWTPLLMLYAWWDLPHRGMVFLRKFRPAAQFLIIGHTHFPGVWTREGLTIINTGAYMHPFGPLAVDIEPERLTVRKVIGRSGKFELGPIVAQFELSPQAASPAQTASS